MKPETPASTNVSNETSEKSVPVKSKSSLSKKALKAVKWVLLTLLLLIVLVVAILLGAVGYFGRTESGTEKLISYAKPYLPGTLDVGQVNGFLLGRLELNDLQYSQPDGLDVQVPHFVLDWTPSRLFQREVSVQALTINDAKITTAKPVEPEEPSGPLFPINLPDVTLPVSIMIEQASITNLTLTPTLASGELGAAQTLDDLSLRAHTEGEQLVIDSLSVKAPQGEAALSGQVTPTGAYPMAIELNWTANLPDQPALKGEGALSGDLNELTLTQTLSGLLAATLKADVKDAVSEPSGALNLSGLDLDLGAFVPDMQNQHVKAALAADFDLNALVLKSLAVEQPESGAVLSIKGRVDQLMDTPKLDLTGQWSGVRYPLVGEPIVAQSPKGTLSVKGLLSNYQARLTAAVEGSGLPKGDWSLDAKGSTEALSAFTLVGNTLEGQINAKGNAAWVPSVRWQAELSTDKINPGVQWPEWPGVINTQLTSNGQISSTGVLSLKADIARLDGSLRDQSLSGKGQIAMQGQRIDVTDLNLALGGAAMTANGYIADTLDLNWSLNAPKLSQVLPSARGSISGTGTVTGTQTAPVITGQLNGERLQMGSEQVVNLALEAKVNLAKGQRSSVSLVAEEVSAGGQKWSKVSLTGEGTPEQHQVQFSTEEGQVNLNLAASGGWKALTWSGQITDLRLQEEIAGQWQLRDAVTVSASDQKANASDLCLDRLPNGTGSVCVKGDWSFKQGAKGNATVKSVSLDLLEPFMPLGTAATGTVQASSDFKLPPGKNPIFDASLSLQQGRLALEDQDLDISLGDTVISVIGEADRWIANVQVPVLSPQGNIEAKATVNDPYNTGTLTGDVSATLSDLAFVSLFTPDVQAVSGQVESQLNLSGRLSEPRVRGYLNLNNGRADLPALGLQLNPITLNVADQNGTDTLDIKGLVKSGEGTLNITGAFNPLEQSGNIALKADRFQGMDTKEIQVWVSPDLTVDMSPTLIKVRGDVVVPEAHISPPKTSGKSVTTASSDVVVVNGDQDGLDQAVGSLVDARVRLTLGDNINVDALGFKGKLQGSIVVEENGLQATRATGNIDVAAGEYKLYGQDLTIERGSVVYTGGPIDNPGLDMRISRTIESDDVTVGAQVSGTVNAPRFDLYSNPSYPESTQLSYLMFGRAPGTGSSSEQALLYRAAAALAMKGGNSIAENLNETLNLDDFGLEGDSADDTALFIGKYLSPRLYIKYGVGLLEPASTFFLRYKLSSRWDFESETGTDGSGGDLIYTLEK
jgi:translocation and assembly module TamB